MGNVSSSISRPSTAALLASFLITSGFATAYLFYVRINRATRLDNLREKCYKLEHALDVLREEIEELKALKRLKADRGCDEEVVSKKAFREKSGKRSMLSTTETEYQSAWSDEEFFDVYDDAVEEESSDINIVTNLPAQEEALELFDRVDTLFEGSSSDHETALEILLASELEYADNVEFLWRIAKACRMTAQASTGDSTRQKDLSYKALNYAQRSLQANADNAEANKWFAISLGSLGPYVGVAEKVKNGVTFKFHIDKAISINPRDPVLHHLLGRFCFEVSLLSWIERKVASTLFAEMPSGSVEEALSHFQNAELFRKKPWKENQLYIARCFVHLGQYSKAVHWVDRAIATPVLTKEEENMQAELEDLRRKYSGYRLS